jgi:histidine ammonia-lyase
VVFTPVIPEKGSVGASGDLAPLAHLCSLRSAKEKRSFKVERMPVLWHCKEHEITPLQLEVKEGLALLNGTQAMGAVGALALHRADRLIRLADVSGAMTLEALRVLP